MGRPRLAALAAAAALAWFAAVRAPAEDAPGADPYAAAIGQLAAGQAPAAVRSLEALAAGRDVRAEIALGNVYLKGLGVKPDAGRAVTWFCRAAYHPAGGEPVMRGIWRLAEYLRTGGGLPDDGYARGEPAKEDPIRALFWFRVLAEQARWYDSVDAPSQRVGRLGTLRLRTHLFDAELEKVDAAIEAFGVDSPPAMDTPCLSLPQGLEPAA